jgi:pimeloyl-ACP methyl ester carboxylesterase
VSSALSRDRQAQAYRPLRSRTLLWQLAVVLAAETVLYLVYAGVDSHFHYATHLLVGLTALSAWQALFLLVAARPARFQLLAVLGFHLWAMWPDLVFPLGVPHHRWMDWVALGHVSSHYLPGGDAGWLVVALAASGAYALLLSRWLHVRAAEVAAGLPPAIGVGGAGVLRPQRDPRRAVLAHESFGPVTAEPLVLLHGLGATSTTWVPTARRLGEAGHGCLVPDLLGFGSSMRLGTVFGLDAQAEAVLRLLDHHGARRAHLVAHSWGCVLAAAVAARAPERVARLTLVTPTVFSDVPAARARFARRSWLARATLEDAPAAGLVCGAMCLLRPLLARLAPRLEPDVPPDVARAGVQHSFAAYADALRSMWQDNPLAEVLRRPPRPITVVLASADETVLPRDVLDLPPAPAVEVVEVTGDHGVAYTEPALMAELIGARTGST